MNIYDEQQQIKDIIDKCEDILRDYPVEHNQHEKIKIWQVFIQFENINYYVGLFSDFDTASRAYDRMSRRFHGDFSYLNGVTYNGIH